MSQNTSVPAKSSAKLSAIVQQECFDVAELQRSLLGEAHEEGAIATFTGYVRSSNDSRTVDTLELEHYPGMTQKSIVEILEEAAARWPLLSASVVHRVGLLQPGDPIVWVGAASPHREAAFNACAFVMDYLKTRAPFWKKEVGPEGSQWVEARSSDESQAERW
ncbi:MAG: molybdopterin synthase catalytic subunit [Halioglobus sp.]|jgi:molybdopterin synthase catalytic subunit